VKKSRKISFFLVIFFLFLSLKGCTPDKDNKSSTPPSVVVTLKPIHSLVAHLMEGRGKPVLLFEGEPVAHGASLRPSQRRILKQADLLVWIGPSFEVFLSRTLGALSPKLLLTLLEQPGLTLLPQDPHHGCHACDHSTTDEKGKEFFDGHIWMDPENGRLIARAVYEKLIQLDPEGKVLYTKNLDKLEEEISKLDQELRKMLRPFRDVDFFVTHQAYVYFCHRYQLKKPGVILLNDEGGLSSHALMNLCASLKKYPGKCVFSEPPFARTIKKLGGLVEKAGGRIGEIDPLGFRDPAGPHLYGLILRRCTQNMVACFANKERP
jgi:zinc transport system substrate-binding protein